MTEEQWLTCTDPAPMLSYVRGRVSRRKLRLFATACVRRIVDLVTTHRVDRSLVQKALFVSEKLADGLASEGELDAARCGVEEALSNTSWVEWAGWAILAAIDMTASQFGTPSAQDVAAHAAGAAGAWSAYSARCAAHGRSDAEWTAASDRGRAEGMAEERAIQAALLRDVLSNPFHPPSSLYPSVLEWNDSLIRRLAEQAYQQRQLPSSQLDNARLAVLADALEEAGVADENILGHLRQQEAVHVRGCAVLDLILGKEGGGYDTMGATASQ